MALITVSEFSAPTAAAARACRILIVAPTFGAYGGMEAFGLALLRSLCAASEAHSAQLVFKLVAGAAPTADLRAMLADTPREVRTVSRASLELWRLIGEADVVHALNPSPDVVLVAKLLRKPLVVTIFNRWQAGRGLHGLLWRAGARLAERCCYISHSVWDSWEPRGKRPRSERVVAVSDLPEGEVPIAERQGFCFVGRFIENKGLVELLHAYTAARIDHEQWPLSLIGEGPLRPQIESLVATLGCGGVRVLGFVDAETKAQALRHCRWVVAPHRTQEDLGLAPIEARSVGVPAIITRDGGLPEAAGAAALQCEPGDVPGLTALLERAAAMDEQEYARRAQLARESLPELIRPLAYYAQLYAEVLSARAGGVDFHE